MSSASRGAQLVLLHRAVWDAQIAAQVLSRWAPAEFTHFPVVAAVLVEHAHRYPHAPATGAERALAVVSTALEHAAAATTYRNELSRWRYSRQGTAPHCPWSPAACIEAATGGGGDPMVLRHLGRALVHGQLAAVVAPDELWACAAPLIEAEAVMARAVRSGQQELDAAEAEDAIWQSLAHRAWAAGNTAPGPLIPRGGMGMGL